ncbi:MAG: hypothetical protein JWO50_798 [Candidatus Kaiserbacteria bacterium]|nr:hypothetical protein [Candidatus Kaiserbacteria bacterium]
MGLPPKRTYCSAVGVSNWSGLHLDLETDKSPFIPGLGCTDLASAAVQERELLAVANMSFDERTYGIGRMDADKLLAEFRVGVFCPQNHTLLLVGLVGTIMQVGDCLGTIPTNRLNEYAFGVFRRKCLERQAAFCGDCYD